MSEGLIVGTAGHIDHGKTSMIRALTGTDLDTLPEEQARGITIALGFTSLELPDGRRAAFVDVPGHERLVRTMIAGATGIDAVLLCVSAVDGMMPQTREHLAILQLLGVSQGAVVLTMADLVDEELLELALDDVADGVAGTFLEGRPLMPFSAVTGRGKEDVLAALADMASTAKRQEGPFRLPVDRTFVRSGFGTVATGTAWSGTLADGATVQLLPSDRTARVRGIETHGHATPTAQAGHRVALNLAGVDAQEVPRGTVVVHGDVPCTHIIDARVAWLADAPPMDDGSPVRLLLGTTERLGRLYAAEDRDQLTPGCTAWAQLRLDGPVPCLPGDRFVLRRTSPLETLGGGEVVDPWTRRMRHKDRVAWGEQIARLHDGAEVVWLERSGEEGLHDDAWRSRAPGSEAGTALADRWFAPPVVARLQGALLQALAEYHATQPLSLGAHRRELRRGRLGHLPDRVFDALVDMLSQNRSVQVDGPLVRVAGFEVALTAEQKALRQRIEGTITGAGLEGVSVKALHTAHPEPEVSALVRLLETEGVGLQVPGVGWVARAALDGLRTELVAWFGGQEELSPGAFKELTGLTRKGAIPLLEWLDTHKWTRRAGDHRVAGARLDA